MNVGWLKIPANNSQTEGSAGWKERARSEKERHVRPSAVSKDVSWPRLIYLLPISDKMKSDGASIISKLYRRCKAYGEFVKNTTSHDNANNTERYCPVIFDGWIMKLIANKISRKVNRAHSTLSDSLAGARKDPTQRKYKIVRIL